MTETILTERGMQKWAQYILSMAVKKHDKAHIHRGKRHPSIVLHRCPLKPLPFAF